MSKENRPAFLFYANDFISSTAIMEPTEVGMYIRLLAHQWVNGPFPSKFKTVCRLAGIDSSDTDACSMLQALLEHKFSIDLASNYSNKRLEIERVVSLEKTAENKSRAKRAADIRWENDRERKRAAVFSENGELVENLIDAKNHAKVHAQTHAKSMLTEYENENDNEDEIEVENRGVQGGMREPKFDAATEARNFQSVYSLRQGKPRPLETAYASCLSRMNAPPMSMSFVEAAKLLRVRAGDFMAYHTRLGTGTQFIPQPQNWLDGDEWKTDWLNVQIKVENAKGGKQDGKSQLSTVIEFNRNSGV